MVNRLTEATSPYLRQHADNPVDWWAWEPAAFAAARQRNVPVLLSVGYSACHWCHVMARESFEDPDTAALMNEHFVNIKVDREERPDVDAVYMEATQAMTGQGGWPMTVFCTPAGEPFYCGTYFPAAARPGLPSFRQVLSAVAAAWRDRRVEIEETGARIVAQLDERSPALSGVAPPGPEQLDAAVLALSRDYDVSRGGFGGMPKFPPSMTLEQLLRHHARTGSSEALEMARRTCEAMARGGIYDQIAGGFARYSVDADWLVPHFEKMLYDNALLLRVYTHLFRITRSTMAARVALETAGWLLAEMRTPQGGFASALDADSEGQEGRYYVWTPAELVDALGEADGAWAARVFGVTEDGTFEEGRSVLRLPADPEDPGRFAAVRERVWQARRQRVPPARDEKVVAAWNGLAIAALAEAGAVFDRPDLVRAAQGAADLLSRVHLDAAEGRLARTSRDGTVGPSAGVLEDYADVAEGFLALFAVTGEHTWLVQAGALLDTVLSRFRDGEVFYDTADDAEDLVRRPRDPTDNATPSGQSAVAGALLSYAALTGSARHREAAEQALAAAGVLAAQYPRFAGWGLAVAEALADGPREVAVVGPRDDAATVALHRAALLSPAPGAVVAVGDPTSDELVELLRDRPTVDGRPAAYVCRRFTCQAPVTDPAALTEALAATLEPGQVPLTADPGQATLADPRSGPVADPGSGPVAEPRPGPVAEPSAESTGGVEDAGRAPQRGVNSPEGGPVGDAADPSERVADGTSDKAPSAPTTPPEEGETGMSA
jgi:uncharacterized protein YyaL (SSP411 family)